MKISFNPEAKHLPFSITDGKEPVWQGTLEGLVIELATQIFKLQDEVERLKSGQGKPVAMPTAREGSYADDEMPLGAKQGWQGKKIAEVDKGFLSWLSRTPAVWEKLTQGQQINVNKALGMNDDEPF